MCILGISVGLVLTPGMFLGHLLCISSSAVMVGLFHLEKVRQTISVKWRLAATLRWIVVTNFVFLRGRTRKRCVALRVLEVIS
jgi:hypothetical protein